MAATSTIAERVERVAAVRATGTGDRGMLAGALADAEKIKAWADANIAALVASLAAVESFPEQTIADTSRCSLGKANSTKERSDTLADTPTLAGALEDGDVTAGHVDAVTRGKKKLDTAEQRDEFIEKVETLVDVAAAGTIEEFQRRLNLEIRRIQADDGIDRLERQKRATRLSHWVDNDGMWNLRGRFDPLTGMQLAGTLDDTVKQLFANEVPEHCPTDAVEKNKFLNAHALAELVQGAAGPGSDAGSGSGAGSRRPEFVVVIDADAPPGVNVTYPIPVELPDRVLAELADTADIEAVVVRNGVVLHAPGNLNLGRTTRLANRAQRRALRALYRCCAVPGCSVAFDRCKIHHIVWWRNGGRTDLHNLLPVCSKHHTQIHLDDWAITLGPDRELTIRLPDGRTMANGPPHRRAA